MLLGAMRNLVKYGSTPTILTDIYIYIDIYSMENLLTFIWGA